MARQATGQVIEPKGGRGWALRFRAYGKRRYITLGQGGWDRQRAEAELRHVLADVERGIWQPHPVARRDPGAGRRVRLPGPQHAQGRKRLLREAKPSRSYLQPEQVAALLAAAGELDAQARSGDTARRRPLLATLTLAGLRISEALDLHWRDVNLAGRKLRIVEAKQGPASARST